MKDLIPVLVTSIILFGAIFVYLMVLFARLKKISGDNG